MKTPLLLICGIVACNALPAVANNIGYNISAQVSPVCGAYYSNGPTVDIDFGDLSAIPTNQSIRRRAGSVTYRCNSTVGFTRTIASQNGGFMTLNGDPTTDNARRIRFTMRQTGAHRFVARQLSSPLVTFHRVGRNSAANLRGNGGNVFFNAFGVAGNSGGNGLTTSTVFAGNYQDTVTITITAN